ncbi:MAG: energy-coupling factor transporter ATPase [Chloroflexota bacterium]|nr:energy-coupling factor transporter ATPase [Chloroflexota bacterium]
MEPLIRIEDASFAYRVGDSIIPALRDVSLSVQAGEYLALIGANGSGKSTLARHLNALLLPDEGRVWVNGWDTRDERHLWDIRRTVGMVFQDPDSQLVATTVEAEVAFGPENLGVPREEIRRRVEDALATVGLIAQRDRNPQLLSAGQKQRLALAGVLALEPECIVLDEATALLDPAGRAAVLEVLDALQAQGRTIVLITHLMDEAAQADRVVVLEKGRVAADAPPREVFQREDDLRRWGLTLPSATHLAQSLSREARGFPTDLLTVEEVIEAVCDRAMEGVQP